MRVLKWLGLAVAAVVVLGGVALGVVLLKGPKGRPAPTVTVPKTDEAVALGKYLANGPALCVFCHSPHDATRFGWPIDQSRLGGGLCLPEFWGLPTKLCGRNLTPDAKDGLGEWSDGEIIRSVKDNVHRDGTPMFNLHNFESMDDGHLEAIVAYLRTLKPVAGSPGQSELGFVDQLAMTVMAAPVTEKKTAPPKSDAVAYGQYLVGIGACNDCHTFEAGVLAGGQPFMVGTAIEMSKNLTPEPTTGLGAYDEATFVMRFKGYEKLEPMLLTPGMFNKVVMPWEAFSHLSEEDLKAIYAYLRTLPPVVNVDEPLPPPT